MKEDEVHISQASQLNWLTVVLPIAWNKKQNIKQKQRSATLNIPKLNLFGKHKN